MLAVRAAAVLVFVLALSQGAARPGASSPEPQGQAGDQPRSQPPSPPPAPQQTDNPQPTFRGGISFVRVDVAVTDRKAQPITDLKQTDFEVFEDGKPQTIETFRLVKVDGTPKPGDPPPRQIRNRADEELEAGRDDVRVFAFLLDDYHVRLANSMSVREPLTRFVRNELRANDLVTVMYPLTPVADLEFTRDHDRVVTALERFEGRKFDYRPRNQFEWNYERYPTEVVERIRNDVVMGALKALAVRLGSLREGRKSIIFVSEGLTAMLPPQMRRADASQPGNPVEAALAAGGQDGPMQITAEWFGQADLYSRLREVYEAANRNNASIYSLDPRGLAPFEFGFDDIPGGPPPSFATDRRALQMSQDTLRSLSEETDGRAIVNRNSLAQGLAQIATDSSFYYLIGYNAQTQNDGKFHEITVRVKRRDVQVRARKGYWAMTPADVERAANPAPEVAKPVQQALASIATSVQAAKYIRTWLGTERGTDGRTRVTLVWEPLPAVPGVRRDPPGRVSLLAADARGNLVFRGRSPDAALASAAGTRGPNDTGGARGLAPAAGPAAAPQRLIFEAPPGKVELRMTVEAAGTGGTLDQEVRTVDVPDLTAPEAAMSTPRVYRARTVREFQALAADATAVPAAGREFSRTERLLIRFDAYGAGTDRPSASAALLNRAGQKMADVPVAPAAAGGTHQIDLGLSSIPGGEYVVEITVKGASGEAKELVPFRVGS